MRGIYFIQRFYSLNPTPSTEHLNLATDSCLWVNHEDTGEVVVLFNVDKKKKKKEQTVTTYPMLFWTQQYAKIQDYLKIKFNL